MINAVGHMQLHIHGLLNVMNLWERVLHKVKKVWRAIIISVIVPVYNAEKYLVSMHRKYFESNI